MNSVRVFFFLGWSRARFAPLLMPVALRVVTMGKKVFWYSGKRDAEVARGYRNGIANLLAMVPTFTSGKLSGKI